MRTFYYVKPTARARIVVSGATVADMQVTLMVVTFLASHGYRKCTRREWREWSCVGEKSRFVLKKRGG